MPLSSRGGAWQRRIIMANRPSSRAAGAPLALTTIAGAVIGTVYRQPTIGVLAGFAVGLAIVLALWARDRSRN
jgi:hypothetical protein